MSDLAATGCGCGSGNGLSCGNGSCGVLLWFLILSCACGGEGNGIFGNGLFGSGDCCNSGCGGNNFIWIIILIALLG